MQIQMGELRVCFPPGLGSQHGCLNHCWSGIVIFKKFHSGISNENFTSSSLLFFLIYLFKFFIQVVYGHLTYFCFQYHSGVYSMQEFSYLGIIILGINVI